MSVADARQSLGLRLRHLRETKGHDIGPFSDMAGWHRSKTSRLEHGHRTPSRKDLETWCRICDAAVVLPDLLAVAQNVRAQWEEWKQVAASGHTRRQHRHRELETEATLQRVYAPIVLPGLVQTEDYARAVLTQCIEFLDTPNDIDQAVAARIQRQQIVRQSGHEFILLADEAALYRTVGNNEIMIGQLRHLLDTAFANPRVRFGVVPSTARFVYMTTSFDIFDNRLAMIETISAERSITAPTELRLYEKAWTALENHARYGAQTRNYITTALNHRLTPTTI